MNSPVFGQFKARRPCSRCSEPSLESGRRYRRSASQGAPREKSHESLAEQIAARFCCFLLAFFVLLFSSGVSQLFLCFFVCRFVSRVSHSTHEQVGVREPSNAGCTNPRLSWIFEGTSVAQNRGFRHVELPVILEARTWVPFQRQGLKVLVTLGQGITKGNHWK